MNNGLEPVRLIVFLATWRMFYETANAHRQPAVQYLIQRSQPEETLDPLRQAWGDKAVKKFAALQQRNWQRWNAAMFEKVD